MTSAMIDLEDVLAVSGMPVAVLDRDGRLAYASRAFRARMGRTSSPADSRALAGLARQCDAGCAAVTLGGTRQACRITRARRGDATIVTLLGSDIAAADRRALDALLNALWGLTQAEAETVWAHARGLRLGEIANERRVSLETVRTQLRQARQKIGARAGRELQARFWRTLAGPISEAEQ